MIEQYAKHFGLDPDFIWQKETDDVIVFIHLWKERNEYIDRYRVIDKALNEIK